MGKNRKKKVIWASLLISIVVSAIIALVVISLNGNTTGDITVSGSGTMMGLKCTDTTLIHPVFADIQPVSHTNTITVNFVGNDLSSIMYRYDGIYRSEEEAANARVLAEADYNLILANEYDTKIDVFSHSFMTDGEKMALTITDNADKVTPRTAPYFLLDTSTEFPRTLDELRSAYEAKGFSCVVENRN